jgi:hypothetical protein
MKHKVSFSGDPATAWRGLTVSRLFSPAVAPNIGPSEDSSQFCVPILRHRMRAEGSATYWLPSLDRNHERVKSEKLIAVSEVEHAEMELNN